MSNRPGMMRLLVVAALAANAGTASSQETASPAPAKPAAQSSDSAGLDFSGIVFANYQYRGESAARSANKFDVERAYLTFRMPAGNRASVRITTDLYQQTSPGSDSYYRGWTVRAKYAYVQYDYAKATAWRGSARLGLLHTVFIEHDESFWPRWIANSPTERAGYFSSADAGIANTLSFSGGRVEVYSTVTNGPGYTSREIDRFKDYSTRVTVRPWASDKSSALRSAAISAWGYKGALGSSFVNGGPGQAGTVGDALTRDRWGVHAGLATPRITFGAQYAGRIDEGEAGANTTASPRIVTDSTGSLVSAYGLVRLLSGSASRPHPLSLLARFDRITTSTESDASYDFIIGGVVWDFSSRLSMSLDYQEATPRQGATVPPTRTWFAHFVARF